MATVKYKPKNKNIVKLKKYLDMNWSSNNTWNYEVSYNNQTVKDVK